MGIFDGTDLANLIPEDKRNHTGAMRDQQPVRVLRVKIKGKWHTRAEGFASNASDTDPASLCKTARKRFSCGGSATNISFELQGDHADKLIAWLIQEGYSQCKRAGG